MYSLLPKNTDSSIVVEKNTNPTEYNNMLLLCSRSGGDAQKHQVEPVVVLHQDECVVVSNDKSSSSTHHQDDITQAHLLSDKNDITQSHLPTAPSSTLDRPYSALDKVVLQDLKLRVQQAT